MAEFRRRNGVSSVGWRPATFSQVLIRALPYASLWPGVRRPRVRASHISSRSARKRLKQSQTRGLNQCRAQRMSPVHVHKVSWERMCCASCNRMHLISRDEWCSSSSCGSNKNGRQKPNTAGVARFGTINNSTLRFTPACRRQLKATSCKCCGAATPSRVMRLHSKYWDSKSQAMTVSPPNNHTSAHQPFSPVGTTDSAPVFTTVEATDLGP